MSLSATNENHNERHVFLTLLFMALQLLLFCILLRFVVNPLLRKLLESKISSNARKTADNHSTNTVSADVLLVLVIGCFISALITECIGLHGIFGAFLFGVTVPVLKYF